MNTSEVIEQFNQYVISNYGRLPSVIVKGQGSYIYDADGRKYLDMFPGWAVSGIGHCHPKVVKALQDQAGQLIHMDNTFYNVPQGQLAQLLSERAFGGQCFFCNSGAEAVEASIKLARLATEKQKYKIITATGGFHGRTLGAITATAQPKYHQGFLPLVPGFEYVPFNDIAAIESVFDDEVAGVLIEPIQGEGGIQMASQEYMDAIRRLCDNYGALAIWDEVQTGMGRTGKWFGYQHYNVEPDIMTMAKSLGGGVAVGGIMAKPEVANFLVPGTHASTFGGNPLACVAASAVIEAIEQENLLENTQTLGLYAAEALNNLKEKHACIDHVRGYGLMLGIQLNEPGGQIVSTCWENGLRINCTQDTVLRFMPAMTVSKNEIDEAIEILDRSISHVYNGVGSHG